MAESVILDPITAEFDPSYYVALDADNGLADLSGNGITSTANGGATVGGSSSAPNGFTSSTDLDGTDDYISTNYATRRNSCMNPRAGSGVTTSWTNSGMVTFEAVTSFPSVTGLPSGFPLTGFHAIGDGNGDNISCNVAVTSGETWTFSIYIYIVTLGGATSLRVAHRDVGGATLTSTDVTTTGQWMQVGVTGTVTGTGNASIRVTQQGAGTPEFYWTASLQEQGSTTGTYFDGSGYVDSSNTWISDAGGKVGWLSTAHASASDKGAFANGTVRSYAGWAARDNTSAMHALTGGDIASGASRLILASGSTNVQWIVGGTTYTFTAAWPADTNWHRWTLVFNEPADTAALYIDGVLFESKTSVTAQHNAYQNLLVGRFVGSASYFDGKVAHFGAWERGLVGGEIGSLYERGARSMHRRSQLDITPWVDADGINWGDAQIQATLADQLVGSTPVDFTIPARQAQIPLNLMTKGGTTFAAIRSAVQAKVGLFQQKGGRIARVISGGGTVYADITNAALHLSGSWLQANREADVEATLTLDAVPDFYAAEEALSDHTETTLPEITFTESTANGGDFPLGDRVRVVVDDDSGQNQRGLFWAFRGRNYSSASTAASAYEAEALQALDTATKVAKVGASGGTVVTHGTISTNWTPVVGTNIGGTQYLTHTGSYRAYARVFTTSGTAVQARFVYDVGDLVYPAENDAVRCYDGGTFHILDLGEVRLDRAPSGVHRWQGQIQARGDSGGESFSVDRVWVVNQDESAGVLRAPSPALTSPLTSFSARDDFNQSAGALNGKTAILGGNWATSGGATDFNVSGSGTVTRTTTSDASSRVAQLTLSSFSSIAIAVDVSTTVWVSPVPFVSLLIGGDKELNVLPAGSGLAVATVSSGLGSTGVVVQVADGETYRLVLVWTGSQLLGYFGSPGAEQYLGAISDDGGTATTIAFRDRNTTSTAMTRTYDNFSAWTPTLDAVCYASRSLELNTQGIGRLDTGGTAYGPVTSVVNDLPRMPNRSSAGTVEFMGKLSQGDLETINDPAIDDLSARVHRRASYLTVG